MPSGAYSTGSYSYVCDGTTPGLSSSRGGVSSYDAYDLLGNLWFVDTGSGQQTYYQDTSGFGARFGVSGTDLSPFKFGGANGCQTDTDIDCVLMGHRYYDTRIGRFLSQDPAGDGDNWYAYCGNNPVNEADPSGLSVGEDGFTDPGGYHEIPGTSWNDGNGHGGASYAPNFSSSTDPSTSSGGLLDGVGGAAMVGIAAVAHQASFGLYNGGEYRHDPSFGVSSALAGLGTTAASIVVPGGGEVKAAGELEELTALWHEGGEADSAANLLKHYLGHKKQMNASSLLQYARKASGHLPGAKKGATKSVVDGITEGVVRYRKNGVYINLAPDGRIISFGR